ALLVGDRFPLVGTVVLDPRAGGFHAEHENRVVDAGGDRHRGHRDADIGGRALRLEMDARLELRAGPLRQLGVRRGQLRAVDHCISRVDRIDILAGQPGIVQCLPDRGGRQVLETHALDFRRFQQVPESRTPHAGDCDSFTEPVSHDDLLRPVHRAKLLPGSKPTLMQINDRRCWQAPEFRNETGHPRVAGRALQTPSAQSRAHWSSLLPWTTLPLPSGAGRFSLHWRLPSTRLSLTRAPPRWSQSWMSPSTMLARTWIAPPFSSSWMLPPMVLPRTVMSRPMSSCTLPPTVESSRSVTPARWP